MLVKVCGLRDPENIRQVALLPEVDLIGLIFYPKSPRFVDGEATAEVLSSIPTVKVVGVFVNEAPEEVVRKVAIYHLDALQLHGSESPEYLMDIKRRLPEKTLLIKAFSISSPNDLIPVSGYEKLCDYFLFDTPTKGYGGSGITFDWDILRHYNGSTPFLLSGGISPDSLTDLQKFQHPLLAGIDLNSRFEIAPALKDTPLLIQFVQNFKKYSL